MTKHHYIAMWSGPRNISTALMRSWENRPDTFVHDEPFYAYYLTQTTYEHPGADEIISTQETDWHAVIRILTGTIPDGKSIYYQKHMTHHLLDDVDMTWLGEVTNCFLIREPREMLTSFMKVFPNPTLEQTGLPQQRRIYDYVRQNFAQSPPVIDAKDVLENPKRMLRLLCERVGVPFYEDMLAWKAGERVSDGVWAKYWYKNVEKSTGFAPYMPKKETVPEHLRDLLTECESLYQEMYQRRII